MSRSSRAIGLAIICVAALAAAPAQVAAQAPVTWLIFVDDLHLEFRNTGRIRDLLRTMTATAIEPGDRFAIASSGPSALAVPITTEREVLERAIKNATGNALRFDDLFQSANGSAEALYRASTAIAAARMMLANSPTDGRPTVMLYLSSGYSFDLLEDPPPGARELIRGRTFTRAEVREQVQELVGTASRAGVRIFTIDRRTASIDAPPLDPSWPNHAAEMRRGLQHIADASGGFAIFDGDFVTQFKRVVDLVR